MCFGSVAEECCGGVGEKSTDVAESRTEHANGECGKCGNVGGNMFVGFISFISRHIDKIPKLR